MLRRHLCNVETVARHHHNVVCASASASLTTTIRAGSYLFTSYYRRHVSPSGNVQPRYNIRDAGYRSILKSSYARAAPTSSSSAAVTDEVTPEQEQQDQQQQLVEWPWYGGAPATEDIAAANPQDEQRQRDAVANSSDNLLAKNKSNRTARQYVPMDEVLNIEMRADHLIKGGLFLDALKHYGVCAKARRAACPDPAHVENIKIMIKLSRAFRLAGKAESAVANLEQCFEAIDAAVADVTANGTTKTPVSAEQVCELLLELGLAKRDLGDTAEAGALLEDAARVMGEYHDLGGSHRGLRLLSRSAKRFSLNFHNKFHYYSPHDWDRTFNVVDIALIEAEAIYRARGEASNAVRALETRSRILDAKNFNSVILSGRIRDWRGKNQRKYMFNTSAPSATELLAFSPTLHQVFHDYSRSSVAPLGREDEVQMPAGARLLDDGDPLRHLREESKSRAQRQRAAMEYIEARDAKSQEENEIPRQ